MFPLLEPREEDRKFQTELANERLRQAFEQRSKGHKKENKIDLREGISFWCECRIFLMEIKDRFINFFTYMRNHLKLKSRMGITHSC